MPRPAFAMPTNEATGPRGHQTRGKPAARDRPECGSASSRPGVMTDGHRVPQAVMLVNPDGAAAKPAAATLAAAMPAATMPHVKTILVVDDEPRIAALARDYLEHAGFAVLVAGTGSSALESARHKRPDLVVLDLGLPDIDGLDIARALRRDSDVPIIMLTARADETDRLVGLELGADDYLTKPFSPRELVARVRAVLRRTDLSMRPADLIRVGDLELDGARMRVTVGGRRVELTPTEFELLATFARQPGRVFTRSQLLDAIHGIAFESYERAIDAHVKNIRRKLEPDSAEPRYLLTVFGVGYRLADPED